MSDILENVVLHPEFIEDRVHCYSLKGREYLNRYYVVSEKGTRKLLNNPEIVGFKVYTCLIDSTVRMMNYFYNMGEVTSANVLSILRGALNYPLEEACFRSDIPVHDISFLSSERIFNNEEISGLDIKYSKLATVPDSTLLIGDIVATGETLIHCLRYVTNNYKNHGCRLRNIIFFTIGGSTGIKVMEQLTKEIREFWPEFEGFITVYYEGVFNCWEEGDKGVCGIQLPNVDFYWKGGVVAPKYRMQTLSNNATLFEKCTIYDGGARRYEISEHIHEVLEYWEGLEERAGMIDMKAFMDERLGYETPIDFDSWIHVNRYDDINRDYLKKVYASELKFIENLKEVRLKEIARRRINEITTALKKYIITG